MAITPRRSTRGTLFTPSPHPSPALIQPDTSFSWTSAPHPSSSSSKETNYNSFKRLTTHSGLTPRKGKPIKSGKADDEARFSVGDGVMVSVEGGGEGVGILTALWEEMPDEKSILGNESGDDEEEEEENDGPKMMAKVHWCFRRQGFTRHHEEPLGRRCMSPCLALLKGGRTKYYSPHLRHDQ